MLSKKRILSKERNNSQDGHLEAQAVAERRTESESVCVRERVRERESVREGSEGPQPANPKCYAAAQDVGGQEAEGGRDENLREHHAKGG